MPTPDPRAIVRGRNTGRSQLTGTPATDWAHRLAAGRGGPTTPANGLWLTNPEHMATHAAPELSRAAGWMVDTRIDPATIPALCICQGVPGWWILDDLARLATPTELEAAAVHGIRTDLTLPDALHELTLTTGWAAA